MNKTRAQEELQTFGSNFTPKRRSLFQSKSFGSGGVHQMYVTENKPQVPSREDWSHLGNSTTESKNGSLPPKRSTSLVETKQEASMKVRDDDETSSTLQLRMEAMTWAAMAKDATILALQQRLKAALISLQIERDVNAQLKAELEMSGMQLRSQQKLPGVDGHTEQENDELPVPSSQQQRVQALDSPV